MQSEPISSSGPVPPGKPPSPQKTRKTRLLLLSGIVLLVLVVSSILAVVLLPKKPSTSGPSTPTVPAGFQQFSSTYFSIIYPLGWSVNPTTSPIGDEFYNPAQSFDVSIDLNESGLNEYGIHCTPLQRASVYKFLLTGQCQDWRGVLGQENM